MNTRVLGGEHGRRGFFGGTRNRPRTIGLVLVGALGAVAILTLQLPGLVATVLAAAVVHAATVRTHRGSPLARWQSRRRWRERERLGTVDFRPVATRPGDLDPGAATRQERARAQREWNSYRDWPDGAEGMHWLQRERGRPGIAWHTPTGEDAWLSVVFSVEGQVRGIESDAFLDSASVAFGAMLARYGSPSQLPNRVQTITRVLPVDSAYHEAWVWEHLDDSSAQALDALIASYDEVVRLVNRSGLMQRHYVVVRWPLTGQFLAAAQRRGPAQEGWRELMAEEVRAVRSHLRSAKLGRVEALSAAQAAAVLRHMQHPSWPIDQAADVDVDAPWLPSRDEWSACVVTAPGPEGEEEQWWHRTALLPVDAFETGQRTSLWLAPLLSKMPHPIVRTLSLQAEVVPAADARAAARMDVTTDVADLAAQKEKGALTDDELRVGLTAARQRLADLEPGSGHHGVGWTGHLTISARSRRELVEATWKVTEAANNAGIAWLEWLDTQQAAASACTWPLARGMRPMDASTSSVLRSLLTGTGNREAIS
ncbi:hypothetical protein NUM3379_14700 [Kineococcus sp. NUM-3379]